MTPRQIIGYGTGFLISSTLWNLFRGTEAAQAAGIFGGSFSMLICLAIMAWIKRK